MVLLLYKIEEVQFIEINTMIFLKVSFYFLLPFILLRLLVQVRRRRRLPPGPISLPIIGNLLNLGAKPHQSLTRLAKTYGPIMSLKLGQMTTIVISSPFMAQQVLQKQDISFSNRFIPDAIRACDHYKLSVVWLPINDRWRSLRKLAQTHVFSGRVLDSNQHVGRRKVEELMSHVRKCCHEGVAVDVGKAAFQTTLNVLFNILFSVDLANSESNEGQVFKDLVWNIMLEAGKPNLVDYFPALRFIDPLRIRKRMTLHFSKMLGLFGEMIDKKMVVMKTSSRDISEGDVLDMLIKICQDNTNNIDIQHIKSMCLDLFAAGTDTTSSTLEWAMTELLRHPNSMEKAKNELKRVVGVAKQVEDSDISVLPFLQAVIKETLRIHPPVPFLVPRQVNSEVELCGYTIPKGAQVLVNVWAIGRDSNHWKNPMEFKPERFLDSKIDVRGQDFELIPFGSGRRICVGYSLAMRILTTMLGSLINMFDWKIDEGEVHLGKLDIEEKFGFTLQRAIPLRAVPIPI